jgi:membrane protease YdiL (CAAX protease family)
MDKKGDHAPRPTPVPAVPWNVGDIAKAIAVVPVGWLIIGFIAVAIADSIVEQNQEYEDNPAAYAVILAGNLVGQELVLLGSVFSFAMWGYKASWVTLGLRPGRQGWWFPVGLALAGLIVIYGYTAALSLFGIEEDEAPEALTKVGPLALVAIASIGMAPFIEETFFRGFVFAGLRQRFGWIAAAPVSSLLFGALHLDPYVIAPFTVIGLLFAWSYHHTQSIWPSVIAHGILNSVAFIVIPA